jgi:circadian clock protein KaiC
MSTRPRAVLLPRLPTAPPVAGVGRNVNDPGSMGQSERIGTGVHGLDHVLGGGLPLGATYLIKGLPGTGKTTLGLQFLVQGAKEGETCLYLCLAETRGQLIGIAEAYGVSLDGVEVHEMRRRGGSTADAPRSAYTVFRPSEVELEEIAKELFDTVDRVRPSRLVIDSLSEIRLLAEDAARYRHELLALCDYLGARACTAMLIDVEGEISDASVAETLVSGVVHLEQLAPAYGGDRRRLRIGKLRASGCVGGYHDFVIGERGIEVYPRLVAAPHRAEHSSAAVPSGSKELDALLGGGLDAGTSSVLLGPAGTGKSTIAAYFAASAASRGQQAAMFCFDESPTNLMLRTSGLGIPLAEHVEAGRVQLLAIDPAEFSPGELSHRIRTRVEQGARVIVLDSINGYLNSLPEERFLTAHLHELFAFLSEKGVVTIFTLAQHGLLGTAVSPIDLSYMADTIVLFRYFEQDGEVRQAISVIKKRTGRHERTIRELRLDSGGVRVGPPLTQFRDVLGGGSSLQAVPLGEHRAPRE